MALLRRSYCHCNSIIVGTGSSPSNEPRIRKCLKVLSYSPAVKSFLGKIALAEISRPVLLLLLRRGHPPFYSYGNILDTACRFGNI